MNTLFSIPSEYTNSLDNYTIIYQFYIRNINLETLLIFIEFLHSDTVIISKYFHVHAR